MQRQTFIPESIAAQMLGYSRRTLRFKVSGTGPYENKGKLPIAFTTGGKGYQYGLQDIEKHLQKTSSK